MLLVMKKVYFILIVVALLCNGCTLSKWFLVDSYGIMTYDRFSGKWELMWEFKTHKPIGDSTSVHICDSIIVDALRR